MIITDLCVFDVQDGVVSSLIELHPGLLDRSEGEDGLPVYGAWRRWPGGFRRTGADGSGDLLGVSAAGAWRNRPRSPARKNGARRLPRLFRLSRRFSVRQAASPWEMSTLAFLFFRHAHRIMSVIL